MPLVFLQFVITVRRTLPFRSKSHAASCLLSCLCSCTQKPLPSGSVVIAFGHEGGVRNIFVVFAIRFGGPDLGPRASPGPRPRASVPAARGAVSTCCAV